MAIADNRTCEVWKHNLSAAFRNIRNVLQTHKYIALDTEFPGVVDQTEQGKKSIEEYQYEVVRLNVNKMKLIQLGISLFDENGKPAMPVCTWQFHFNFNNWVDTFECSSFYMLKEAGIDFSKLCMDGIDPQDFGFEIIGSGLVLQKDNYWLVFQGNYDFGYLIRILSGESLDENFREFQHLLRTYFVNIYDVKHLMKVVNMPGGLQHLANMLEIKRSGRQHQAGSDSFITGQAFFKMKEVYFHNRMDQRFCGTMHGLGFCEAPPEEVAKEEEEMSKAQE